MAYDWTFYRDRIVLDQSFKTRVDKELLQVPIGKTLLLAARDFQVAPNYTFELVGYNLVILAEVFDGATGTIRVLGLPGQPGGIGGAGPSVTVACRELKGVLVKANGGCGGSGMQGMPGLDGKPGRQYPNKPGGPGGPGGKGEKGGNGGDGGQGGNITLIYLEDEIPGGFNPSSSLDVLGGPGGNPGPGGPGGAGGVGGAGGTYTRIDPTTDEEVVGSFPDGPDGPPGPDGDPGSAGQPGGPGSITHSQLSEAEYWAKVRPLADQWSDYRLRWGEYYFRAYNSKVFPDYLTMALGEFRAVLALDPGNSQAAVYRERILNNENILGLARDMDIIPDFPRYEHVVTSWGPVVISLFQTATSLLATDALMTPWRDSLTRELVHINNLIAISEDEKEAAAAGLAAARSTTTLATRRANRTKSQLEAAYDAYSNAMIEIGSPTGPAFTATIGVIVTAVGAIFTGGKSLMTVIPALIDAQGTKGERDIVELMKSEEERKSLEKMAGGIKELVGAGQIVLSFPKMLNDAIYGKVNDAMKTYQKLLIEEFDLVHEQMIARLREEQAVHLLRAAELRLQQASTDLELAQDQLMKVDASTKDLEQAARALIRTAQAYMDVLIKYAFLAARSLEIYTFIDASDKIFYDYGYIHPDEEEELTLTQLIGRYASSWSRFAGILGYRDSYESYFLSGTLQGDIHFLSFKDAASIESFRQTYELVFTVDLKDLPSTRKEAKAVLVYVALVGAKANAPAITCMVEHSGRYYVEKRDGTQVYVVLSRRPASVRAGKTALQYSGTVTGGNPMEVGFWGRGVAAMWHLYIEQDVITIDQVDLSGLSEIQIGIGYQSFTIE